MSRLKGIPKDGGGDYLGLIKGECRYSESL
jgi:hypothetical protein